MIKHIITFDIKVADAKPNVRKYKSKYKMVGVLPIVYSLTFRALALHQRVFLSDEGPMLVTLDYIIGSTPTFLYFELYLYSAYATHYVRKYSFYFDFLRLSGEAERFELIDVMILLLCFLKSSCMRVWIVPFVRNC